MYQFRSKSKQMIPGCFPVGEGVRDDGLCQARQVGLISHGAIVSKPDVTPRNPNAKRRRRLSMTNIGEIQSA